MIDGSPKLGFVIDARKAEAVIADKDKSHHEKLAAHRLSFTYEMEVSSIDHKPKGEDVIRAYMDVFPTASSCIIQHAEISRDPILVEKFSNLALNAFIQATTQIVEAMAGLRFEPNQAIALAAWSGFHGRPRRRRWLTCSRFRTSNGPWWAGSCPRTSPGRGGWTTAAWCRASKHMLRAGGRWRDVPADYGPATTVYDRFNRWSRRGFWPAMLAALAEAGWTAQTAAIDSTYAKAHRCAHGGKGGRGRRRSARRGAARPRRSTSCPTSSDTLPSSTSPRATAAT